MLENDKPAPEKKFPTVALLLMILSTILLSVVGFFILKNDIHIFGDDTLINIGIYSFIVGVLVGVVGLYKPERIMVRSVIVSLLYAIPLLVFFVFVAGSHFIEMIWFEILILVPFIFSNTLVSLVFSKTKKFSLVAASLIAVVILAVLFYFFVFPYVGGERGKCAGGGGSWITFSGCQDSCSSIEYLKNEYIPGTNIKSMPPSCPAAFSEGCDCGKDACWDGEKCVSNDEYLDSL